VASTGHFVNHLKRPSFPDQTIVTLTVTKLSLKLVPPGRPTDVYSIIVFCSSPKRPMEKVNEAT